MKAKRHAKIIELVDQYDIETQDDLAEKLNEAGFNVTQATISRDIRELKLSKVPMAGGKQKYIAILGHDIGITDKYSRVLKDGYLSKGMATNLIVIKTVAGMAMAVAAAIDAMDISGIVGCIAGDDTIMCAIQNENCLDEVMEQIDRLIKD